MKSSVLFFLAMSGISGLHGAHNLLNRPLSHHRKQQLAKKGSSPAEIKSLDESEVKLAGAAQKDALLTLPLKNSDHELVRLILPRARLKQISDPLYVAVTSPQYAHAQDAFDAARLGVTSHAPAVMTCFIECLQLITTHFFKGPPQSSLGLLLNAQMAKLDSCELFVFYRLVHQWRVMYGSEEESLLANRALLLLVEHLKEDIRKNNVERVMNVLSEIAALGLDDSEGKKALADKLPWLKYLGKPREQVVTRDALDVIAMAISSDGKMLAIHERRYVDVKKSARREARLRVLQEQTVQRPLPPSWQQIFESRWETELEIDEIAWRQRSAHDVYQLYIVGRDNEALADIISTPSHACTLLKREWLAKHNHTEQLQASINSDRRICIRNLQGGLTSYCVFPLLETSSGKLLVELEAAWCGRHLVTIGIFGNPQNNPEVALCVWRESVDGVWVQDGELIWIPNIVTAYSVKAHSLNGHQIGIDIGYGKREYFIFDLTHRAVTSVARDFGTPFSEKYGLVLINKGKGLEWGHLRANGMTESFLYLKQDVVSNGSDNHRCAAVSKDGSVTVFDYLEAEQTMSFFDLMQRSVKSGLDEDAINAYNSFLPGLRAKIEAQGKLKKEESLLKSQSVLQKGTSFLRRNRRRLAIAFGSAGVMWVSLALFKKRHALKAQLSAWWKWRVDLHKRHMAAFKVVDAMNTFPKTGEKQLMLAVQELLADYAPRYKIVLKS